MSHNYYLCRLCDWTGDELNAEEVGDAIVAHYQGHIAEDTKRMADAQESMAHDLSTLAQLVDAGLMMRMESRVPVSAPEQWQAAADARREAKA